MIILLMVISLSHMINKCDFKRKEVVEMSVAANKYGRTFDMDLINEKMDGDLLQILFSKELLD